MHILMFFTGSKITCLIIAIQFVGIENCMVIKRYTTQHFLGDKYKDCRH